MSRAEKYREKKAAFDAASIGLPMLPVTDYFKGEIVEIEPSNPDEPMRDRMCIVEYSGSRYLARWD
jgi:hypothetical protein